MPDNYYLKNKLNGVNAPLILEDSSIQQAFEISFYISLSLMILVLIQFYVGSYTHKMIGLETIQIVQFFYFAKMIVSQKKTTILNSLNSLKYSANGYSNPQVIFDTKVGSFLGA